MSNDANSTYRLLCDHARETALLTSIEGLLEWDERVGLPPAAGEYRAEQITYLAGMAHRRQTDPRIGDWLGELTDSPLAADPHSDTGATIRQLRRNYEKKIKLPQSLVEELARTAVLGQQAWTEARENDDFARFQPLLERTIALKQQEADAVDTEDAWRRLSEVEENGAVLVRPDGHVAWRSRFLPETPETELRAVLSRLMI